jgi:hypothetical protein
MKPAFLAFVSIVVVGALTGPVAGAGPEPPGPSPGPTAPSASQEPGPPGPQPWPIAPPPAAAEEEAEVEPPPGTFLLEPLSLTERAQLAGEFVTQNGFVHSTPECDAFEKSYGRKSLEIEMEYGLISVFKNWCPGGFLDVEITDEAKAIETAKDFLVRNAKFTGVARKEDLKVTGAYPIAGCLARCGEDDAEFGTTGMKVKFADQIQDGLEIPGTAITVFVNAETVFEMHRHWYPRIEFKRLANLSETDAMEAVVGTQLTHYNVAGMPVEETVTRGDVRRAELAVAPRHYPGKGLAFQLEWKVFVATPLPWVIWLDDATGNVVRVDQRFAT